MMGVIYLNELQIYENPEFGKMRSIQIDGEPWFVGKDVAAALGYADTDKAIREHIDDEDKNLIKPAEIAGLKVDSKSAGLNIPNRGMYLINESGVYALIFGSKLDSAKRFKHWVTHEVLPSIRKTGSYTLPGYASLPQVISIVAETKKRMKAEGKENWEIAHACYEIGENYGITLPKFFAEDCKMPDEEVVAMVDFACEHPEYQQNPDAGYYAFVLSQCTVRQLRGRKPKKLES